VRSATILVADDDRAIRTVLHQALGRQGHTVRSTGAAATLWQWVREGRGQLVITDVLMPDENGLDLVPRIRKIRPDLRIIVMSAQSTLLTAVRATERGAYEYLPKPFDLKELVAVVNRALSLPADSGAEAKQRAEEEERLPLIGRSSAMQEVYRALARLMASDLTVMVSGESGTGKELVARALHDYGTRRTGPFVALNMAAIAREQIEVELFGSASSVMPDSRNPIAPRAARLPAGKFEQAAGGTLFLDEIGDMPPEAQTRLLRVLQEGEYRAVGGRAPIKADVRIIAATHRDLRRLVQQGLFREDLFYRLNVVPIRLPPLRERLDDIPELTNHFLASAAADGLPTKVLSSDAMARLRRHRWPGNVRELENLLRRLAALCSADVIELATIESELADTAMESEPESATRNPEGSDSTLGDAVDRHLQALFTAHGDQLPPDGLYERVISEVERPLLAQVLEATRGNQLRAARLLGLNRNTLRKKIKDLDVPVVRTPQLRRGR
jgi:two-component system nitrogen regulation response regulator GlnG